MEHDLQKVALIHDLSGIGRCSLGAAIPVLACMGMQACPVPTAVLSTQTDGFTGYHFVDLTDELPAIFSHFEALGIEFGGIYTGFLGSLRQIGLVMDFIRRQKQKDTLVLIDPVMGDDGVYYSVYDGQMAGRMRELVSLADVITPNLTEAALLLGRPMPDSGLSEEELFAWTQELCALGPKISVITGAKGRAQENSIAAYDAQAGRFYHIPFYCLPVTYPGTGDLFASVLMGLLMKRRPLKESLERAADFVYRAIARTAKAKTPVREGVLFERELGSLLNDQPKTEKTEGNHK